MSEWTSDAPTEPGDYLFYGDYVAPNRSSRRPQFHVCHAHRVSMGVVLVAGGQFLYKGHFYGVFKPLTEEKPDLSKFGLPVDSDE